MWLESLEARRLLDATPLAPEFQVNELDDERPEQRPAVARDLYGNSLVVWDNGGQVFRRHYSPTGLAADQHRVDEESDDQSVVASLADVAMDAAGSAFVVWHESRPRSSPTSEPVDTIVGRKLAPDGTAVGGLIDLAFDDPDDSDVEGGIEPKIAMNGDGNFVVVYRGGKAGANSISARRFDKNGVQQGGEIVVAEAGLGLLHRDYDVAMAASGDFVVVWQLIDTGVFPSRTDIVAQRFSALGSAQGATLLVNPVAVATNSEPSVAAADDGTFVVSWTSPDEDETGIFARAFDPSGADISGGALQVNTTTRRAQVSSDISIDKFGVTFTVVWNGFFLETAPVPGDHRKVFAQEFALDRQEGSPDVITGVSPQGGEILVNPTATAGSGGVGSLFPVVAGSACGDLIVAWQVNAPVQDIFARLFDVDKLPVLLSFDSDEDGLSDCWELHGYSLEVEGVQQFVNLPDMGADPMHKDIFVEVDYMGSPSQRPSAEALMLVRQAFANAPVENPDGVTGITLHIDHGGQSSMHPGDDGQWGTDDDARWIAVGSQSQELAFTERLGGENAAGDYLWDDFDELKFGPDGQPRTLDDSLLAARALAFHYAIYAYSIDEDLSGGISRNGDDGAHFDGAGDFVVSVGAWNGGAGPTVIEEAGTFMHELGHNLGLGHGGGDHVNHKPNYLSVMNYSFQDRGLLVGPFAQVRFGTLDFSRWDLDDLDENHLDENAAISGPGFVRVETSRSYGTVFFGPNSFDPTYSERQDIANTFSINWDGSLGGPDDDVQIDINHDGEFTTLPGYNDWANLVFTGGGIGGFGAGQASPQTTTLDELTFELASQMIHPHKILVSSPSQVEAGPGQSVQLTFTLDNLGTEDDVYDLAIRSPNGWGDASSLPASTAVLAGQSAEVMVTVNVPAEAGHDDSDELTLVATSQGNPLFFDVATTSILGPDPLPWQNSSNPFDVDQDGVMRIRDVVVLIKDLLQSGVRVLENPTPQVMPPPFVDVNGDGWATSRDVAELITAIVTRASEQGEGEPTARQEMASPAQTREIVFADLYWLDALSTHSERTRRRRLSE